jgi:prepilin-type N-terminal cleavage/methylation domain-containing protein
MRATHPRPTPRSLTLAARRAFTLVELLVVMGILLVLIGLALLVANSGLIDNYRLTGGSDRIAGWLMQAKTKAKRTGFPCGVRFVPGPDGYVREAQLIEVPDPYNLPPGHRLMIEQYGTGQAAPAGPYSSRIFVVGPNAGDVALNVAVGDTLSIPEFGTLHRVTEIRPVFVLTLGGVNYNAAEVRVAGQSPPYLAGQSKLPDLGAAAKPLPDATPYPANPNPPMSFSTTTFGFIRQARPVFGEEPLKVADGIAIDVANSLIPNVNGNLDVVFSPNGEVQNTAALGRVILWVRNPEAVANPREPTGLPAPSPPYQDRRATYLQAGEMSLVTVYSRTGAVAVHPVLLPPPNPTENDPVPGHDPYQYTRDGIASGL